jgi:hypothetical protein
MIERDDHERSHVAVLTPRPHLVAEVRKETLHQLHSDADMLVHNHPSADPSPRGRRPSLFHFFLPTMMRMPSLNPTSAAANASIPSPLKASASAFAIGIRNDKFKAYQCLRRPCASIRPIDFNPTRLGQCIFLLMTSITYSGSNEFTPAQYCVP